jgi:hypothetical protein
MLAMPRIDYYLDSAVHPSSPTSPSYIPENASASLDGPEGRWSHCEPS